MKTRRRAWLWSSVVTTALALLVMPSAQRTVATPMVLGLLVAACFTTLIADKSRVAPVAELGVWFVGAVTIYMVMPLAIFLILGQRYTPLNDNRLFSIQPSSDDVARVAWLYFAFLASFAFVYIVVRGNAEPNRNRMGVATPQTMGVLIAVWVALQAVSFVFIPTMHVGGDYGAGYVAVNALPLGIRQILKITQSWGLILTLGLRAWLFKNFAKTKWLIVSWIAYDTVVAILAPGARTVFVLSLGASFMLYHFFVRPVKARTAIIVGVIGVTGFIVLGFLRSAQNLGNLTVGQTGGEFESLFANAVDLQAKVAAGQVGYLPLSFHLADLLAAFPSQTLPFVKQDPAAWYQGFYPEYADRGGGFAFGAIAQGIVGFGWLELVVRGSILGFAFARIHRYFTRHTDRFWIVVFYIWLTIWGYQSFRNQSFILLASTVQEFLPLVLVVEGVRKLFKTVSSNSAAPLPHIRTFETEVRN